MLAALRVGISVNSAYAVDDPRNGARQMVERARAASEAGLDSLFVGDHHAVPIPYYQNSVILGRMLAEWRGAVSGALYLLPLWHPVLLAEQVGTLASLAPGRFVLQCALGPDDAQFPAMGISARERRVRFEACLGVMRRLFSGEVVDADGPWTLRGARIAPLPPEPIAVWIGAVAGPAIERAARLGDGWIASPHLGPDAARRMLAEYEKACEARGRPRGSAVIRRDVYTGESAREARATAGPVIEAGHRGFPPDACVVGSVDETVDAFSRLAEMGYDEVLVRNLARDPSQALGCIERLGEVRRRLGGS